MSWHGKSNISSLEFTCGHCGKLVASSMGYTGGNHRKIYICPHCDEATYMCEGRVIPGPLPGASVMHVPVEVNSLYNEARMCVSANCFTGSVLLSRKLLMNVAVAQGAEAGKTFISYVEYLAEKGYVPPNGKGWVDHIRTKGNEATHEIHLMTIDDANELIAFLEMLLKFIYEFPNKIPAVPVLPVK